MSKVTFETMLDAGVHFGHLKRKWNPSMAPYIFDEKKGIHVIDLNKTLVKLEDCLLYTSPSPRDREKSRMPSSA